MTIKKGEPWGRVITYPGSVTILGTDRQVADFEGGCVGVSGGDLWRVLGEPLPKSLGDECTLVEVDRLGVTIRDGARTTICKAVSHVRVGRWTSWGRFIVATNLGQWGRRVLAPRAHPNDGFVHVLTVDPAMGMRERLIARRRAIKALHVPHPLINVEKSTEVEMVRQGREALVIDGRAIRRWTSVRVTVLSDDLTVVI